MAFTINTILEKHVDKKGLQAITIQVIFERMKAFAPSGIKIIASDYSNGNVINNPLRKKYNLLLQSKMNDIRERLLDASINKQVITLPILKDIVKGNAITKVEVTLVDFFGVIMRESAHNLSEGRLKHYKVMQAKVTIFDKNVLVSDVDYNWLLRFEKYLLKTGIVNNTLKSNMSILNAILNRAVKKDLLEKNPFVKYDMPKVDATEAIYLTTEELASFQGVVEAIGESSMKRSGYYFLLSCYFGYRISDSLVFDPSVNIINGSAVIRAKKNGKTVNMPVLPFMQKIIDYVGANPINLSEQKVRDYVKKIAELAGITKHVKFHTARHTFAMNLLNKGVGREFVADLLGDTIDVSKIYAHIANEALHKEIWDKLG